MIPAWHAQAGIFHECWIVAWPFCMPARGKGWTLLGPRAYSWRSGRGGGSDMTSFSSKNVTVVLGPTNTGKTHLALERMTGYASGLIGFPLRLLARENYDRLVARLGAAQVGLITGEERILPAGARYICCTVESMPMDPGLTDELAD